MIWRATQTDRDDICCIRGGLRRKQSTRTHHAKISHQDARTCTHSVKTTLPVAPRMPPGFFLSICGDRMTIRPPTTRTEPCWNAHKHTDAGETPQKYVASLLKSSMSLVCLIESFPDSKTNKPCCTQSFISAPLLMHHYWWNTGDSVDIAASDRVHQSMGSLHQCMWVSQPDASFLKPK